MELNKGQEPDLIPPIFLRECAQSLAGPISIIYEKSLVDRIYPTRFKLGQLTPIYKDEKSQTFRIIEE